MSNLFRVILSMSLSGSAIILLLLLIRPLLKERFSKAWQYYIWMIVLIRLLVPYSPEHSLVNDLFQANIVHKLTSELFSENNFLNDISVNRNEPTSQQTIDPKNSTDPNAGTSAYTEAPFSPTVPKQADYRMQVWNVASFLWLIGVISLLIYKLTHYIQFMRELSKDFEPVADHTIVTLYHNLTSELGIRRVPQLLYSNKASSPMLAGLFRSAIYLTDSTLLLQEEELSYILRHELIHHKRHDIWYKWFCELALSIHWFNPFLYLLSHQINSQCEISCDEAVARDLSVEERRSYGSILLNTASENINYNKHTLSLTLYEDKISLKERILTIMNAKRKTRKTIILSISVALLISSTALMLGACSLKEDTPEVSAETNNASKTDITAPTTPTPGAQEVATDSLDASSDVESDATTQNTEDQDSAADPQLVNNDQDHETDSKDNITYSNTKYGFDVTLPASWEGYTIQSEDWQGTALEGDQQGTVVETGTKIMIRHPKWTVDDPYQDIPIMVFTLDQWDQVSNERIAVSAAPFPPSELGRNSNYVFALPARYNYAFPTGYEEVDQIIQDGALTGNENYK